MKRTAKHKPLPMPLSLVRAGQFTTNFVGDAAHKCGQEGVQTFAYSVTIRGTDEALSPEGFLIENSRVQTYFNLRYAEQQGVKSCETIACYAARAIGEKLVHEGISVLSVSCTIIGSNSANITATWYKPGHGAFDSGERSIRV